MTEPTDPGPTVVILHDKDGVAHWTAATSPFAVTGLADGTLTEHIEENPDATEVGEPGPGDDAPDAGDDTATGDNGPGDGEDGDTGARRGRGARKV